MLCRGFSAAANVRTGCRLVDLKPQIQWRVAPRADCEELAVVLARFPFRGRKRRELEVWSAAVRAWSGRGEARRNELRRMDAELRALRAYSPRPDRSVPASRTSGRCGVT